MKAWGIILTKGILSMYVSVDMECSANIGERISYYADIFIQTTK
jgi:hypothetical protein